MRLWDGLYLKWKGSWGIMEGMMLLGELWGDLGRVGNVIDGCGSNGGNGNGLKQKGF